jgi:hypothetical protein
MDLISRAQFLDRLQNSWQTYFTRFYHLTPAEKKAFLDKQGYANLSSLLAHILAWWQDGAQAIDKMRTDPTLPLAEYDVDTFNARAVAKWSSATPPDVVRAFQKQCQVMIDLVQSLSDEQLAQTNINTRLYYEIIMHWTEHELSD